MATTTKGTYVYFGGGLHPAKDNADASRLFSQWRDHNGYGASNLGPKDGRLYTDGRLTGHVSYNGRIWDAAGKEIIASNLKLAADELDDKGVIASFTKLLLKHLTEGDDVTEQLHALNYLRQQAGMKPIEIPAGGFGAAPQQEAPKSGPRQQQTPPSSGGGLVVHVPSNATIEPDNRDWTNRFKIKSESSERLYTIAQNKKNRHWGCDCPGWISRRNCKHLRALGLPGDKQPFEATLKQGSKKTAGKFKLYTGPTIVKETADILRNAGINVTTEGTEHVHFIVDGDRDGVTLQLREILGPQWGVKNVQQLASKQGAESPGPEAGPSNDELHENGHSENGNGGSPMLDGNLKSPERQNVNAIREALETQVEMEVGKPIEQKQQEMAMAEKVQDAELAQGGAAEADTQAVTAKPGTQIIINVASKKAAYIGYDDLTPAGQAVMGRIQRTQPELAVNYGADAVLEAVYEATSHLTDLEEIGSSDVSIWTKSVLEHLAKYGKQASKTAASPALKEKLHPQNFKGMSGKWVAIIGFILDEAFTDPSITEMAVTSDGMVMAAHSDDLGMNDMIGSELDLQNNWKRYCETAQLDQNEMKEAAQLFREKIVNYRNGPSEDPEEAPSPATWSGTGTASLKDAANRVVVSEGSGIDSGKEGVVIPWDDPRTGDIFQDYPFVGGRTPQSMGWLAILLDGGDVTTVPSNRVKSVKRSAEPIGGEPEQQPGITSGHAGGMFGGTDLEGPSFHVGFTFKGYHREASFTSAAEAEKFITAAKAKFGKQAGDWTMKCPKCGNTASKDKPQDSYQCGNCGWNSETKTSGLLATPALGSADFQQGYTDGWNHEGPANEENQEYTNGYWKGYDDKLRLNKTSAEVEPASRNLVMELLKSGPKTTKEIETALGGGKYTNLAYPLLQQFAKEGLVAHKQMRWSLKTAGYEGGHEGWTNYATFYVNALIDNTSSSYDNKCRLAQQAVDGNVSAAKLAATFQRVFARYERQARKEHEENNASSRDERGAYERRQLEGVPEPSTGDKAKDIANQLWNTGYDTGLLGGEEPFEDVNWTEIAQDAMDTRRREAGLPEEDEFAKQVGIKMTSLRKATLRLKIGGMPQKGSPEWHQLQIAIKTLKMPAPMAGVMGGPDEKSALATLARFGLRWDNNDYMAGGKGVKKAGDGMAKTETELEKEAGFNFFFPGQVLKEFYPEIQHEIVDYPNATNQSMSMENPEIVGDAGHELEGVLDQALDTNIVEMIQLPADVEGPFSMAAADYVSTKPGGAMGIGRDGKPEVLDGAPLRKENDIRGGMFTDEFYGQYEGIPGAAFAVASKTAAEGAESQQFAEFLNFVCGEIAATMVAAFKVTHRPLLDKVPGVGEIQLDQIEQGAGAMLPPGQVSQGGRVKFLLEKLNDGEVKAAINEAWAQSAVWHEGDKGGFVYEVFVRPETIDTDSLKMKYKFVCGTKG